jgi:adenylate cyclase
VPASPWSRLKEHKVLQWSLAYLGAALALAHGQEILAHNFHWPEFIGHVLIGTLIVGFPIAVALAWYHGHKGMTRFSAPEMTVVALLLVIGSGLLIALVRVPHEPTSKSSSAASTNQASTAAPAEPDVVASRSVTAGTPKVTANAPEKSIAVLPFVDMSEKHDQEYFSDGLSEELIELLTKVPELRIPARTSSFYFKGKAENVATIARELGVAHVLEGSVRKAGNTVRVTAQLVRADSGYHLWSENYDRDVRDIFKVQDDIAAAVVDALKAKLAPISQATSSRTSNPEAHTQYLLGRQFWNRRNIDGFQRAVEAYRNAIALDPNYAAAYAGLAPAEAYLADATGDAAGFARADAAAEKAVALAPDFSAGYAARGDLRRTRNWDWAGAQADFARALALDPADSDVQRLYGNLLACLGRFPQAIAAYRSAIELDPLANVAWENMGRYMMESGNFAGAKEALQRALEIQPESEYALNSLATLQLLEGNAAEALVTFRRNEAAEFRLSGIAMAEHTLQREKESRQALDGLIAKYSLQAAAQIAQSYAWRGEKDKAFEWLDRAYRQQDGGLAEIKIDLVLANLRDDPRYKAFLRKLNLPE